MSGPPDEALRRARVHLSDRGYLHPALPPAPRPAWRTVLRRLATAASIAAACALTAVSAAGAPLRLLAPLALALFPACAVVALLAAASGRAAARLGLRVGMAPGHVATILAALAGVALVGTIGAAAGQGALGLAPALPGLLAGAALAVVVVRSARRALLADLAYRTPVVVARWWSELAVTAAVLAVGATLVLAQRQTDKAPLEVEGAVFPPAQGRIAVVAVDGLARADLEAAPLLLPGIGLERVALWGWAPLKAPRTELPAVFWTTVACGVPPATHGVVEIEDMRLFGCEEGVPLPAPLRLAVLPLWRPLGAARLLARPALTRRSATFWEMASRAGCPVTVGGWWGSWPVRQVLGEIASERAWLGGAVGADSVTPGLVTVVREGWQRPDGASVASGRLATALVERAMAASAPHVLALALPGLDLERRGQPGAPPIDAASRALPHLRRLALLLDSLERAGYSVWLVAAPWGAGRAFVASSVAPSGVTPPVDVLALAGTWLDQLGLPLPLGAPPPCRELSRAGSPSAAAATYGPPPPVVAAPAEPGQAVQRELLRNLGYLQ